MLRRLGGWALVVVGVLLTIAGALGAIVVGPDDAVRSDVKELESPGAAIVTGPGAIEYAGPTLRLEARSTSGPVFIGVGDEVDVQDLMADVTHTQIDEIGLPGGDVRTSEVQGSQGLLADTGELDWWIRSSEGDEAVVAFSLPDHPVSVVVTNADGSAPVQVEVAAEVSVKGLFWGTIAVVVVGLGLFSLGALGLIRGRARRRAPQPSDEPEPVAAEGTR